MKRSKFNQHEDETEEEDSNETGDHYEALNFREHLKSAKTENIDLSLILTPTTAAEVCKAIGRHIGAPRVVDPHVNGQTLRKIHTVEGLWTTSHPEPSNALLKWHQPPGDFKIDFSAQSLEYCSPQKIAASASHLVEA